MFFHVTSGSQSLTGIAGKTIPIKADFELCRTVDGKVGDKLYALSQALLILAIVRQEA